MLGYTESVNYANLITLYKDFIDNTVNPRQDFIEYVLNDFIQKYKLPELKDYYVKLNDVSVEDEFEQRKLMLMEQQQGNLTINEYREKLGKEAFELEEATVPLVSKAMIRVDDVALDAVLPNEQT